MKIKLYTLTMMAVIAVGFAVGTVLGASADDGPSVPADTELVPISKHWLRVASRDSSIECFGNKASAPELIYCERTDNGLGSSGKSERICDVKWGGNAPNENPLKEGQRRVLTWTADGTLRGATVEYSGEWRGCPHSKIWR